VSAVANGPQRLDHSLIFKNGMKFVKRSRRIGQVLFETFGEYQLRVANCLGENKDNAVG